jgi:hypothetical protein
MRVKRTGQWEELDRILKTTPAKIKTATVVLTKAEADFFEGEIRRGIKNQAPGGRRFKPLSPSTIAARRASGISGDKALIATEKLLNGIKARRVAGGWFTGIRDKNLARIGAIHEEGLGPIQIKITPRMRAYLFAVVFKGRPKTGGRSRGVVSIKIPARPFIKPVLKREGRRREVMRRLMPQYARIFGGDMGRA